MGKFNLIYKVPDEFRYASNGDGTAEELPDSEKRYFAKKTGSILRDFMHANNCEQIKYGVYGTNSEEVVKQFIETSKRMKATLEQVLFEQEKQALKNKDASKLKEVKEHKEFLADNWDDIKPECLVQTVVV